MSIVEKKFQEALYFFQEMEKSTFDPIVYEANLSAFINASRNISYAIQKEGGNEETFTEWWEEKRIEMREDELMKFFYELRNYSIKQADNKVSEDKKGLTMRHRLSFDGKGGCKAIILSRNGEEIDKKNIESDPNASIFLGGVGISMGSGLFEKMYFFDEIEQASLANRDIQNITDLCFEYLCKLDLIVQEYFEKVSKLN